MSPKVYGFLKTVGLVIVFAILTFLANSANLGPYLSPTIAGIVAGIAGMIEEQIKANSGNGILGSVRLRSR